MPGLRQAGDVVDLDYPPFFIDRVEDAVPPGPQAPQIRRPVRERLRRPRLIGELANSVPERSDADGIVAEEARRLVQTATVTIPGGHVAMLVAGNPGRAAWPGLVARPPPAASGTSRRRSCPVFRAISQLDLYQRASMW